MGQLLSESTAPIGLDELVRDRLAAEWAFVNTDVVADTDRIPPEILHSIRRSINSKTKTYRYVLPTQLLAKCVRPELDCRSVQAGSGLTVPFDARSICHGVIVPFDRENHNVLGGSAEPYLNNPLRIPALLPAARTAQKDKDGFDDLLRVLDFAQQQPRDLASLVRWTFAVIRDRLTEVAITYPVPNRVSLKQTVATLDDFLGERTGGLRLQSVAVALFRTLGDCFGIYESVQANNVNAADASTGSAADLECVDSNGEVVLAVEVKDRTLQLRQLQDKLPAVREKGIRELLFVVQGGVVIDDIDAVERSIVGQFVTGQNLYIVEWEQFLGSCLVLFGEKGRREFLQKIGSELDQQKADISHRKKWAALLTTL